MGRIDDFKGTVSGRGGFVNPTLYKIELPPLPGSNVNTRDFSTLCSGISLPGRQIQTIAREIGTEKQFVGVDHEVPPVSLTFRMVNDFAVKKYFEYWQNLIINQKTHEVGYANTYHKDVKISQLAKVESALPVGGLGIISDILRTAQADRQYPSVYECTLIKALPTSVTGYQMGDAQNDQIVEFTVELQYKNWINHDTNEGPDNTYIPTTVGDIIENKIKSAVKTKVEGAVRGAIGRLF